MVVTGRSRDIPCLGIPLSWNPPLSWNLPFSSLLLFLFLSQTFPGRWTVSCSFLSSSIAMKAADSRLSSSSRLTSFSFASFSSLSSVLQVGQCFLSSCGTSEAVRRVGMISCTFLFLFQIRVIFAKGACHCNRLAHSHPDLSLSESAAGRRSRPQIAEVGGWSPELATDRRSRRLVAGVGHRSPKSAAGRRSRPQIAEVGGWSPTSCVTASRESNFKFEFTQTRGAATEFFRGRRSIILPTACCS